MNELDVVRTLLPHLARRGGDLLIGAGEDDAACWREADGAITVATCDASVEWVHFDLAHQAAEDVGWRALCMALGDLAAKGARPTYGLVSLAVPSRWAAEVPAGIYRGLAALAAEVGLRLVGGDTTAAPANGFLSLALLGRADVAPIARADVAAGWLVGVTGPLGGAFPGWARPRPRLALGRELAGSGACCGDISDGLVRELDKFAAAAGVGALVRLEAVPRAAGADAETALSNGEEVELVVCRPGNLPPGVWCVGELTGDGVVRVIDGGGAEVEVRRRGYDHFE